MELKFVIQEVRVEPPAGQERLQISIVADGADYQIIRPLPKSSGHKTLTRVGAGYEWAYLPSRDIVRGDLQFCQDLLVEMYGE